MNNMSEPDAAQTLSSWRLVRHWAWVVVLGAVLILLGATGIAMSFTMILPSVLAAGWFLLASGLVQALHTFSGHPHRSFGLDLLTSVSYAVLGAMILSNTVLGGPEFAVLLSLFFTVIGVFRIIITASEPIVARLPVFITGIVALFIGIRLWAGWPSAGLWTVAFYVGIEIAVSGWSLIMRGLAEKRLPGDVQGALE